MKELLTHIASILQADISLVTSARGGDISDSYRLEIARGNLFLKVNDERAFPQMFEKEARGLDLLRINSSLQVPLVKETGVFEGKQFILMEFVTEIESTQDFYSLFGTQLANMHRVSSKDFGLDEDNFIGALVQRNAPSEHWTDFFINQRLDPLLRQAFTKGLLEKSDLAAFQALFRRLDNLYPHEKPAFIHGDLWSGNFLSGNQGEACIFDPAVYFGHREMDLAMTRLFGGFDDDFYHSYEEEYSLEPGWEIRCDLWNLYPLLVHLNLFGSSYIKSIRDVLTRFS